MNALAIMLSVPVLDNKDETGDSPELRHNWGSVAGEKSVEHKSHETLVPFRPRLTTTSIFLSFAINTVNAFIRSCERCDTADCVS